MDNFLRYIGATVICLVAMSIPILTTLAVVFDWGFIITFILGLLCGLELLVLFYIVVIYDFEEF